ncbi:hypothetical protein GCM10010389_40320 [Streptomyces echinoruber]|uniref:Uncharacterized protein n=1 Tax=Streptomyces echinoruber TaxID=68898 RepID=A0A918RHX5_9ACTN|nr:hypothetical protein GCM10010389_40320 [Streptomyces echinoruber]
MVPSAATTVYPVRSRSAAAATCGAYDQILSMATLLLTSPGLSPIATVIGRGGTVGVRPAPQQQLPCRGSRIRERARVPDTPGQARRTPVAAPPPDGVRRARATGRR